MNIQRIALLAMFFTAGGVFAAEATYKVDPAHSSIGFRVKHMGISNVRGQFTKFEGTGSFDEKNGKVANIKFTIDPASVDTREADRDAHLRKSDFFDVEKHKEIKFESTNVITRGNRPTEILGKLTIKGVTKDVKLAVTEWGGKTIDPWGNERIGFSANGKINRLDFGVSWNKPLDKAKGLTVGNDVEMTIEIEAIKNKVGIE